MNSDSNRSLAERMYKMERRKKRNRIIHASMFSMVYGIAAVPFGIIRDYIYYGSVLQNSFSTMVTIMWIALGLLWIVAGYLGIAKKYQIARILYFVTFLINAVHIFVSFYISFGLNVLTADSWFPGWIRLAWPSVISLIIAMVFTHILYTTNGKWARQRRA